jgi:uncharacterized protein YbjT (DUF2867 family)
MILVVGASGVLGREVTRQLLGAGHRVRATSRDPAKLTDLQSLGAEVMPADLIDRGSLDRACGGVEAVLAAAHSIFGAGKYASEAVDGAGHRALIDAAKAAGVKRFVYTSASGASPDHPVDFMRTKAVVEGYLEDSGLDFTILRPTAFMEWHVHELLGKSIVETGKTTIFGPGVNPNNFIAASDVASFAVAALDGGKPGSVTLNLGGPDNICKRDVVRLYERCLGRPAQVRAIPLGAMRVMAPLLRPFRPVVSRLLTMAIWTETTDQTFDVSMLPPGHSFALTGVDAFVRKQMGTSTPLTQA